MIIAFLTLILALVSLAFSAWRYNKIRREELKQKRFTNYHDLIRKLVSGQSGEKLPQLDSQVAIIYELRNYPEYRDVTIRILEELCQYWTKFKESDKETKYDRLLKEIPLTLSRLPENGRAMNWKKGIQRITRVLAVAGFLFWVGFCIYVRFTEGWKPDLWIPLALGVLSFIGIWVVYYMGLYIVKGFFGGQPVDEQKQ